MFENQINLKIVKKRKNELYDLHFEFERTINGKIAYCKNCEPMKEIKMKNSNTSGLIKHLQNTHFDIYKDIQKDRPLRPSSKSKKPKPLESAFIKKEGCPSLQEFKTEENISLDNDKNESSESVFSYSDPLLYNEDKKQNMTDLEEDTKNDVSFRSTEDIVKFLLEKQYSQDDADIQGKSWANQYRQLTLEQQIHVKKRIDDIFYEARLECLRHPMPRSEFT